MNALCALHSIRLRVEENRLVALRSTGSAERVAAIRHELGYLRGIMTHNGWMVVMHPDNGLFGLPLNGVAGTWQAEWENESISIEVCTSTGWVDVTDWSQVLVATSRP